MADQLIAPKIFEALQQTIDDDSAVRDTLKELVQALEKSEKKALAHITNAQSLPQAQLDAALQGIVSTQVAEVRGLLQQLGELASRQPYYKFNGLWTRAMQDAVFIVLLVHWHLGGGGAGGAESEVQAQGQGQRYVLMPLDAAAASLGTIPPPADGQDVFHLTTEEYLHGMISLLDELARLSRTSVTMGDYARPLVIARFVKDVHAGFGLLNLKNDSLRKRGDGIKYKVRETEDVVYDLSLRGLAGKGTAV